ncbi:unnamed protein product [Heterobilharzia americana]|nr:unnamed protein product [Heterobilharzia americana]
MIWSWEYITKLLVPCEILIITKLLFCFITFPNNLSLYTILSIIIKTIFSSPITVFSLFLFINWFTYYAYLVYFIIISSSSIYSDVYKLIHFGITYQVPFTLDNIELFIYTYTSTLYFLELLNIDECIYDINCCLLLFISFRLYSYLNCWQILRLSNKFYTNLLDTHLFSFLTFYSIYLLWLFTVSFYIGSQIFIKISTFLPNTILCTSIFLLIIHINLILTSIKFLILPIKNYYLYKKISTLSLLMKIISFITILLYSSWKFYLSETSLTFLGYAEIPSHVIFLTVIFCLLYTHEKLLPLLNIELFPIHTTTFLSSEYCSLCILPLYRPIILSSSLTYNSTSECQHLLHVSCATIAKLISFPCLRCSEESFIFIQETNNISVDFDESQYNCVDTSEYESSSLLEDSSSNSSVYDDKDIDLNVYLNLDHFKNGKIGRTIRRLDGSDTSSSSIYDQSSIDSKHYDYDYFNYESEISNL